MKYKIYVRPDAEVDIEEAAVWYEKKREGMGGEFLDEVQDKLACIEENPYLYAAIHRNTRRALIHRFPFCIFYRIKHDLLIVFAVLHGSRHPKRWRERI